MSIPIFRTDNKTLRTLGISPGAYGWLSVAATWIARGKWESGWYNPGPWFSTIAMNRPDITKTAVDGKWK